MEPDHGRAVLLVTLGLCPALLAGCPLSDQCAKCALDCTVSTTTPVAWIEPTALGSPEQLFASYAGTCQAPFQWDGSGWSGALTVTPPQGQSTLTATVVLDTASARLLTYTSAGCPDKLEIDGTATLELPEGKVADHQPFTIGASAGMPPSVLAFAVKEDDFGPWVSIRKSDPSSTLSMPITVTSLGRACAGEVGLSSLAVHGKEGNGFGGPLASWSDTGCGVGQIGVSLAQPWQGIDVGAAIAAAYGQVTLSGTWSDGSTTALALATSTSGTVACAETLSNGFVVMTVPANVVASTADGRVPGLSGQGTIRVSVNQASLWELDLSHYTDLTCATEADTLPYTGASCATDRQLTAQLRFTRYATDPAMDGGSLDFYVYERQSQNSPNAGSGVADRMDRLTLGP
jgi:hypothetical protein